MFPTPQAAFQKGVKDISPILIGGLPFGMLIGVIAASLEFTPWQGIGNSAIMYAGSAQLVMLELIGINAALWVVVLSASIVNLRMVIYSASLARYVRNESLLNRIWMSFVMVDQVYAFVIAHLDQHPEEKHIRNYWAGLSAPLYPMWTIAAAIGYFIGAVIPDSWSLTFGVPLMFLAMLVPALKGRPHYAAAAVAVTVALTGINLPHNLGLVTAILSGVATGALLERLQ